jgi:RNA polymerase sigma-70 factor (ECF subfamily)
MTPADSDQGRPANLSRTHILEPHSLARHVDRLYRAAWGMCGSHQDAEDLVQETFARVLSRRRVLRRDDDLHYLFGALRNTCRTSRRRASRRPATTATLGEVVAEDPSPSKRPESALEIREVYANIAELPDNMRLAMVAVDVLGLTYRQAARALNVPEATITTRLFRARARLAAGLVPAGVPAAGARSLEETSPSHS